MKTLMIQLFDYHRWANKKLLQHLKGIPNEVFHNNVDSVFPTISETFGHIISVDEMWYLRTQGVSLKQIVPKELNTIEEAEKIINELHKEIKNFLINTESIEDTVTYTNTRGETYTSTISEIIQHLVNHGTYHRGNIAAMIRQMGYEGTPTDYIAFLRTIK